jgi:hypothetical protein
MLVDRLKMASNKSISLKKSIDYIVSSSGISSNGHYFLLDKDYNKVLFNWMDNDSDDSEIVYAKACIVNANNTITFGNLISITVDALGGSYGSSFMASNKFVTGYKKYSGNGDFAGRVTTCGTGTSLSLTSGSETILALYTAGQDTITNGGNSSRFQASDNTLIYTQPGIQLSPNKGLIVWANYATGTHVYTTVVDTDGATTITTRQDNDVKIAQLGNDVGRGYVNLVPMSSNLIAVATKNDWSTYDYGIEVVELLADGITLAMRGQIFDFFIGKGMVHTLIPIDDTHLIAVYNETSNGELRAVVVDYNSSTKVISIDTAQVPLVISATGGNRIHGGVQIKNGQVLLSWINGGNIYSTVIYS